MYFTFCGASLTFSEEIRALLNKAKIEYRLLVGKYRAKTEMLKAIYSKYNLLLLTQR